MRTLLLALAWLLSPTALAAQGGQLAHFLGWFEGEFNNHEQVWQQEIDKVYAPAHHIHTRITRLPEQSADYVALSVMQSDGVELEKVYRQRVYRLSQQGNRILLKMYKPSDSGNVDFAEVDGWRHIGGCDEAWTFGDGAYTGTLVDASACLIQWPGRAGKLRVDDILTLTNERLILREDLYDLANGELFQQNHTNSRKVRYYQGWAGVQKNQVDPNASADDWIFARGLRLHNEGQRIALLDKDGSESGFEIQLAKLTYQNTKVPILVLKLFRSGETKSFAYSWAETDSSRVGINLRWIQTGWTAE